jgi:hypothetical protein
MQHKNVAIFPDNEFYAAPNQGAFMLSLLSYSLALLCIAKKPAGVGLFEKQKSDEEWCPAGTGCLKFCYRSI